MAKVEESSSLFFKDMHGMLAPIVTAHGEGFADYSQTGSLENSIVSLRFTDHTGQPTEQYPLNPNGAPQGIAALTTVDGRFTIMMPHPERVFRTVQHSWAPRGWGEDAPWLRIWRNARRWVG
mgnify:FL=1